MSRHFLGVVFLAACLSTLPAPAAAAPITIDFEDDGFFDFETVTQIGDVSFSDATLLSSGTIGGSLNEFELPPLSGTNVLASFSDTLRIDFTAPLLSFGAFFTYVAPITLEAFDAVGNRVGFASSGFGSNLLLSGEVGSSPNEFLSLAVTGMAYVTISGGAGAFVLDDLTYELGDDLEPIPEPSTLLLVGTGVAALVRRRYTQRNERA
jgi:hypothetical protein